jgi:dihydrodipicolinate synthase/N-acetylneuraminate lyase
LSAGGAWHGVWGFPLTPFAAHGIDTARLTEGTELQLTGGVDVLCACGLIAQLEQLSPAEYRRCAQTVIAAAAGRVPVIVTVRSGPGAPALAADAEQAGAAGIVVVPHTGDPSVMLGELRSLADAAPGLLQVLYHRPPLVLGPDRLRAFADVPELAWIKDGHRDVRMYRRLRAAAPRLRWVSAWEDVALAFWAMGCDTFAPASTAYAPRYALTWLSLLRRGDVNGARALLAAHAYPMVDLRLSRPGIDVSVVKEAMRALSAPAGRTRPPAQTLSAAERSHVHELVAKMDQALSASPSSSR